MHAHETLVRLHGHTHVEARAGHRESTSAACHLTALRLRLLLKPMLVTFSTLGGQEAPGVIHGLHSAVLGYPDIPGFLCSVLGDLNS